MIKIIATTFVAMMPFLGFAQELKLWTESDRKYLVDNLTRSRDELVKETEKLSEKQGKFKESPDRWSINEVVEHLALYELVFDQQISQALYAQPHPEYNQQAKPDSAFFNFIMETKPHFTKEYQKPFTYTSPMGLNELKNNMAWFLKMRNESIDYLKITKEDLRAHYVTAEKPNPHQIYIYEFGHVDRAMRQIRKIKQHPKYPH